MLFTFPLPERALIKGHTARKRGRSMTRKSAAELRCSNGAHCAAYPALGEPSKLSRGNPGSRCFACEERRVASELKAAAAKVKAERRRKADKGRLAESDEPNTRPCAEHSCEQPAAVWNGEAYVCREHAKVQHARAVRERRRRSVLTCERGLRSALASGDERLARRWSRSLRQAEARLADAEADLDAAEIRARSQYAW